MCAILLFAVLLFGMTACGEPSVAPGPEKTIGLGESYLDKSDFKAALEQFLLYIGLEPEDEYGYLCAAEAYIGMDDAEEALDILENGYSKTGSERIYTELAALYASSEQATASEPAIVPAEEAMSDEEALPEDSELVALKDGESLYGGHLDCPQAKDFRIRFVLSADRSYIHDVEVAMTDLKASIQTGNRTTTAEVSNLTETYSGEYPVNFDTENYDISIGESTIRVLFFYDDSAFIELDYIYYNSNPGGGMDAVEIPLDTIGGELKVEKAPAPAAATDPVPPPATGPNVFPIEYEAYGNDYSITGYTIGKDDSNNTVVTLWGNGYGIFNMNAEGIRIAATCKFDSKERTYDSASASLNNESLKFTFDTSATPEIITVTNGETHKVIVSFSVADVRQR
jgi:tetratricopeptide (TPR) repeat protein